MGRYELKYTAEKIDELLESVEEKTIYNEATQSEHGLMSATDKTKLNSLPTSSQIDTSLSGKVDKVEGKGLSENDYTDDEKASVASAYQKPQSGVPKSDLAQSVQTSLSKADTALQSFTEQDPTVPSWAKQSSKPSYDYAEIGNTPDLSGFITKSVNDLTNYYLKSETYTKTEVTTLIGAIQQFHYEIYASLPQSGESNVLYLIGPTGSGADKYEEYVYSNNTFTKIGDTSIDLSGYVTTSALNTALASYTPTSNLASVATSGSYNDLKNKPTIPAAQVNSDWNASSGVAQILNKPTIPTVPTNVSAFNNDAGYLTQHQSLANYVQKSQTTGLLKNDGTVDTNTYLTSHQDISGKADKITIASSMPSGGFLPNVVYNLGALSGDTTFLMASGTDNTIANIWCWTFDTPSTAPTITWPQAITAWNGGSAPTINASKHYEVSVMNGIACIIEA